jgi:hypothetical protein
MNLDEILQLQVLKQKSSYAGRGVLLENLIEEGAPDLPLRQMCAKVSAELYSRLENICGALDMSKREFIEAAVSDALDRAVDHIHKAGGFEALFGPGQPASKGTL